MYPVSAAFTAALAGSHRVATSCIVAGNVPLTIDPSGSTVTLANNPTGRTTCKLTLTDPTGTLTPADAASLLHPLSGNEFTLARGIHFDDDHEELVPLGVFGIVTTQIDDSGGDLVISLTGADRADAMARARLAANYPVAGGGNVGSVIQALLAARVPSTVFAFDAVAYTAPAQMLKVGDDPYAWAQNQAAAAGAILYYDRAGTCRLQVIADPTTAGVAAVYQEGASCTIAKATRKLTRVGVANHVIRDATAPGITPARGEAMDSNPNSPTRVGGRYGDVVDYASSNLLTSQAQAQAQAQADLWRSLGSAEAATLTATPHPGHDPFDVVQAIRSRMHMAAYYVADSLSIPMSYADTMQLAVRKVYR